MLTPTLFWGSMLLEVLMCQYVKSITEGRVDKSSCIASWFKSWGWYYDDFTFKGGLFVIITTIMGVVFGIALPWVCAAKETTTVLQGYIDMATTLSWVFYPVTSIAVLFIIHKILKRVVTFGYSVSDKLDKLEGDK